MIAPRSIGGVEAVTADRPYNYVSAEMSDGGPGVGPGGMIVYKPVVNTWNQDRRPQPGRGRTSRGRRPSGSIQSIGSIGSIQSIGSVGSILSIGSAGSVVSIGSAGSVLSIGSAGSILSIGSAGSIASVGSAMSVASFGGYRERPSALVQAGATVLAIAALVTAVTGG